MGRQNYINNFNFYQVKIIGSYGSEHLGYVFANDEIMALELAHKKYDDGTITDEDIIIIKDKC